MTTSLRTDALVGQLFRTRHIHLLDWECVRWWTCELCCGWFKRGLQLTLLASCWCLLCIAQKIQLVWICVCVDDCTQLMWSLTGWQAPVWLTSASCQHRLDRHCVAEACNLSTCRTFILHQEPCEVIALAMAIAAQFWCQDHTFLQLSGTEHIGTGGASTLEVTGVAS